MAHQTTEFDPSETVSSEYGIFGLPFTEEQSKVILIPVPWEVTTSYGVGASRGPEIIRHASEQIDLFDLETGKAYEAGFFMREISTELLEKGQKYKQMAQEVMRLRGQLQKDSVQVKDLTNQVNAACEQMTAWVKSQVESVLAAGKIPAVVGGDHSTPLGAIAALAEKYQGKFAVLHFDAHADLRLSYQGFQQSHASIMRNVMTLPIRPQKLVQVGIRDFCEEEYQFIKDSGGKIQTHFDINLKDRMFAGETWHQICQSIASELPEKVYISFDIDGLEPALCPNTGTPVAGGLSLNEAFHLFKVLANHKKQVIGFDLNEVSPGTNESSEWDGNVGARVLYKLCGWAVRTNS